MPSIKYSAHPYHFRPFQEAIVKPESWDIIKLQISFQTGNMKNGEIFNLTGYDII